MHPVRYAGFYPRMLAHNIDLVLMLPFCYLLGTIISNNYLLLVCCWLLYILYHMLFELTKWHGTPGKRFQRMIVVDSSLSSPKIHQIFLRNLTKLFSILPLFAGIILIAVDPKSRGLHDRLAGTLVIFS